jgi:hypothetical protein
MRDTLGNCDVRACFMVLFARTRGQEALMTAKVDKGKADDGDGNGNGNGDGASGCSGRYVPR